MLLYGRGKEELLALIKTQKWQGLMRREGIEQREKDDEE
jgi:hypothetical protein